MGGYGSGKKTSRMTTVEECLTLSIKGMAKRGMFKDGASRTVTWTLSDGSDCEIGCRYTRDERHELWLIYSVKNQMTKAWHSQHYPIVLSQQPCRFGGVQWYFLCPIEGCGGRVRSLHLPAGLRVFGCRKCYQLTYVSTQRWDKRRVTC